MLQDPDSTRLLSYIRGRLTWNEAVWRLLTTDGTTPDKDETYNGVDYDQRGMKSNTCLEAKLGALPRTSSRFNIGDGDLRTFSKKWFSG